jgi:nucleotide-binding universal stress UspA family protein
MKPIVVPVSFTANSRNAARYAADLAGSIGADIHLLYSFQVPMSLSEVPMPESAFEDLQGTGLDLLSDLSEELTKRTNGKVKITTSQLIGTVEGAIENCCEEKKPLLVVMGATGAGLENALLGGNTVRAVRRLPYPILVIPEGDVFKPIHRVMVACDQDDLWSGLPLATPILQLLGALPGMHMEVVHVITHEESASEFTQAYNHWKNDLKGLQPELFIVRALTVVEGLNLHLRQSSADLVLVFPKHHGMLEFHRSQARRVVLHCPLPVLTVHE